MILAPSFIAIGFTRAGIPAVTGHGDIMNPEAWIDVNNDIPPKQFSNVPNNVNFPQNGDGRYWFQVNTTYTDTTIAPQLQLGSLQNGDIIVPLAPGGVPVTQFYVKVTTTGGTPSSTAKNWQVTCAITRNVTEGLQWDAPNPFNPINYNGQITDNVVPTDTLANLR